MNVKTKFLLTLLGISAIVLPIVLAFLSSNIRQKFIKPEVTKVEQELKVEEKIEATPSVKPATP